MLPAFSSMAEVLATKVERVQLTIPFFTLTLAISQFFYGFLSDRFGRKPIMAAGLILYLAGSIVCSLAPNIDWVLAGRVIQGAGAACGAVLARAILRDTHSGVALASAMALATAIFSLGPIIAPLAGLGLQMLGGWRAIFLSMAALAIILLTINLFAFKETNLSPDMRALRISRMMASLKLLLTTATSLQFIATASIAYCALMTILVNVPLIYEQSLGATTLEFAVYFALAGLGIAVGQFANRQLLKRFSVRTVIRLAASNLILTAVLTLVLFQLGWLTPITFALILFYFNTSFLVVVANSLSLVLDPYPDIAGFASAFFGMVTLGTGSVFVAITATFVGGDANRFGMILLMMSALSLIVAVLPTGKTIQA